MKTPRIIAHRGASWARPENTAPAFDLGLQEGAEGLELDLQLTRDEQVVVFHDKTLAMLGMRNRRIAHYTRDELRALDAGSWYSDAFAGTRILDLDEVLERYGEITDLYLEIKPVGELKNPEWATRLARRVADRVNAHQHLHRIYVLSFSEAVLLEVLRSHAHLRCVHNLEHPHDLDNMAHEVLDALHAVCVDIRRFDVADVARVHQACRHLFAYTVDTPRHLKVALELEVDAVISNGPAQVRETLATLMAAMSV